MIYEGTFIKVRQIPICVCNLSKKLTTINKTKPLASQRVGFDNEQPRVTRLMFFIMPSEMWNY